MNECEFYRVVLGLEQPWEVTEVSVDAGKQKVEVTVACKAETLWACPESRERLPVHDHVERRWRHLDTCQFETELVCRVPRLRSAEGNVWTVPVPWAEARNRFSALFEQMAITVLLAARSLKQAAAWLRLDWSAVERLIERAVERGLERRTLERLRHLGLDEKSFLRGQSDVSVMVDLEKEAPRVLEVCEGRKKEDARELIGTLPEARREQIEAVAMDLSPAYHGAVAETLPHAAVVFDKFHVSKVLGDAARPPAIGHYSPPPPRWTRCGGVSTSAWRPKAMSGCAGHAMPGSTIPTNSWPAAPTQHGTKPSRPSPSPTSRPREPTITEFYFWSSGRQPTSPAPNASLPNGITRRGAAAWNPSRKRPKRSRATSTAC